jgi:protein-tyrosine phosphatase
MKDWFERLMGFRESTPAVVRERLSLEGTQLVSMVNGARVECGWLELPSLAELRELDREIGDEPACRVTEVMGDVAALHRAKENAGALFQAASQFNLLEMIRPSVTPEEGVGIYEQDPTQGPACARACGGGTIYRNYFAQVAGQVGQTAEVQIDCLADLERELGPGHWEMRNGYALASEAGLAHIAGRLNAADEAELERLRGLLRVGVQHQVGVLGTEHRVTQVYGSALPVSYGGPSSERWEGFARLVLEASYEATLRIARIWQTGPVYLTLLGGGAFGNESAWIEDAVVRAAERVRGLDLRIVSYSGPSAVVARILERCPAPAKPGRLARTSRSHPLLLDLVEAPGGGPVGVTFAPGKIQPGAMTGAWNRSLEADLDQLARVHQVDLLVSFVEDHELETLRIPDLVRRGAARGLRVRRFPIVDGGVPGLDAMVELQAEVAAARARGERVAFHCKGGLGRAGTGAACCLVFAGVSPASAIARVRAARPGAVETTAQERFIEEYAARHAPG